MAEASTGRLKFICEGLSALGAINLATQKLLEHPETVTS